MRLSGASLFCERAHCEAAGTPLCVGRLLVLDGTDGKRDRDRETEKAPFMTSPEMLVQFLRIETCYQFEVSQCMLDRFFRRRAARV